MYICCLFVSPQTLYYYNIIMLSNGDLLKMYKPRAETNIVPRRVNCFRTGESILVFGMKCGFRFKRQICEGCTFNK